MDVQGCNFHWGWGGRALITFQNPIFAHRPIRRASRQFGIMLREKCWTQKKYQKHEIMKEIIFLILHSLNTWKNLGPTLPTMQLNHQQLVFVLLK